MIHHTIGIYPNGEWKCNGVQSEHLAEHIAYNLRFRPGRTFYVDWICLNKGPIKPEVLEVALKAADKHRPTSDTAPYV